MPERGIKRRSSDSTCDSSSCIFCIHRFPHPPDHQQQHDHTATNTDSPNVKRQLRDFDSWLAAQQDATAASALSEDVAKIGLPTDQLEGYAPFRHSSSKDSKPAQHSQQPDQLPSNLHQAGGVQAMAEDESPWSWCNEWNELPTPTPAVFREVMHFQQPYNSSNMRSHTADILCGVEFSPDGHFLASAGVAKQVRLYSLSGVLFDFESQANDRPITVQRMPSKLSSLAWDQNQHGVVTVGDYDGVLSQLHLETGHFVADRDENAGRRIWSIAHSQLHPNLAVSASDDGTAKLWGGVGLEHQVGIMRPSSQAPVCDASFCNHDSNLVAVASANHNAYVYDMRRLDTPLHTLTGHDRAVSYAKFLSAQRVVTASVDGTLACWDLPPSLDVTEDQVVPNWEGNFSGTACFSSSKEGAAKDRRRFMGHQNAKNFVGLSVRPEDGLMACGAETSSVFAYNTHWSQPLARYDMGQQGSDDYSAQEPDAAREFRQKQFVSAVDWMPCALQARMQLSNGPLLAAAMSEGTVRVLSLNSRGQVSEKEVD